MLRYLKKIFGGTAGNDDDDTALMAKLYSEENRERDLERLLKRIDKLVNFLEARESSSMIAAIEAGFAEVAKAIRETHGESVLTADEARILIERAAPTLQRLKNISKIKTGGR